AKPNWPTDFPLSRKSRSYGDLLRPIGGALVWPASGQHRLRGALSASAADLGSRSRCPAPTVTAQAALGATLSVTLLGGWAYLWDQLVREVRPLVATTAARISSETTVASAFASGAERPPRSIGVPA